MSDTEEKVKEANKANKESDKELINKFNALSCSMSQCFGAKDVMALDILAGELEDRGFELEEYTSYRISIDGGDIEFDDKGNAIRED